MYAPKYCDNRLAPEENMLQKVIEVNRWIQKFNKENTGKSYELTSTCVCVWKYMSFVQIYTGKSDF